MDTHRPARALTGIGLLQIVAPLTTCLVAWLGIFLRGERPRAFLPIRTNVMSASKMTSEV